MKQQQNNWGRRKDKWPGGQKVEITAREQNIGEKKKWEEMMTAYESSETALKTPTFTL